MNPARLLTAAIALACACAAQVQPADFPSRAVRYIVAFPPGGTSDLLTRLMAQRFAEGWMHPVVVDNRPGAGGNVGAQLAAKAPADGYTLFMSSINTHAINAALYRNPGYDHVRDFAPVAKIATVSNVLVVNPALPVRTVQELLAYLRANAGRTSYGSAGSGTSPHLSVELLKSMTGVNVLHVPYKGSAPALNDLLSGQLQLIIDNLPAALALIRGGKLRALAVTAPQRVTQLPDVPTMIEAGIAGYDVTSWWGLFVPAGTPAAIVVKINADAVKILRSAEMRDKLTQLGAEAAPSTPDELAALVRSETARWAKVVRDSGAAAD